MQGGHEHQNWYVNRGTAQHDLPIAKADANTRTVFTHKLRLDMRLLRGEGVNKHGTAFHTPGALKITSSLSVIDADIKEDPIIAARVDTWWSLAAEGFRKTGIDPDRVMARLPVPLDARESVVRNEASAFGALLAQAYQNATLAEAAPGQEPRFFFFNSGSIRVDDVLGPGLLNEYDVLRILPFSGYMRIASTTGDILAKALERGVKSPGAGAWPAYDPDVVWRQGGEWWLRAPDATKEDKKVNPQLLRELETVVFGTTEYIINRGDGYFTTNETQVLKDSFSRNVVEVLRDTLKEMYPV